MIYGAEPWEADWSKDVADLDQADVTIGWHWRQQEDGDLLKWYDEGPGQGNRVDLCP